MGIHATEHQGGVGAAARELASHATSIAKLEIRLALAELREKAASLAAGIGLVIGAAVVGLFAVGFALATVAAALALVLPLWLALLLVAVALGVLAASLAALGKKTLEHATPPVPDQAIAEARLTTDALRRNGY